MEIDLQQYIKKTVLHLLYQLKQKERNLYWLKCMIYNVLQEMLGMFPTHLLLQKNYTSLLDQNLDKNLLEKDVSSVNQFMEQRLEQYNFMDHYLQKFDLFIFYHQELIQIYGWGRRLKEVITIYCKIHWWCYVFFKESGENCSLPYLEDLYTLKGVGYPQFYLGYVDADHARNYVTRRSVTGGYFE